MPIFFKQKSHDFLGCLNMTELSNFLVNSDQMIRLELVHFLLVVHLLQKHLEDLLIETGIDILVGDRMEDFDKRPQVVILILNSLSDESIEALPFLLVDSKVTQG